MIPLRDANPTRRTPVLTLAIIVACTVVFAYEYGVQAASGDTGLFRFFLTYGIVPVELVAAWEAGDVLSPPVLAIVSSMFLHGGILHLGGNMLYLWIFGNNIEDRFGRLWFVVFYLAGGVAAALTQVAIDPASDIPLVGASGAIAATLGAYIVLFPGARILSVVFLGILYQLIEVPAIIVLGFWFVLQIVDGFGALGAPTAATGGGVAFFAHIGGFAAGLAVGLLYRASRPFRRDGVG